MENNTAQSSKKKQRRDESGKKVNSNKKVREFVNREKKVMKEMGVIDGEEMGMSGMTDGKHHSYHVFISAETGRLVSIPLMKTRENEDACFLCGKQADKRHNQHMQ